jgi:NIMA-interacting peptidyl-prolyl cis-trans isomerase 1
MNRLSSYALALVVVACGKPAPSSPAPSSPAAGDVDAPAATCIAAAERDVAAVADEPVSISLKHIVVKYAGAERAPDTLTRERGEACMRALEALDKMKAGTDFDELVGEYSDEDGAASRNGSLGAVTRTGLDPAFADAAFALDVRAVSYVVASKFGFHVIVRTE